MKTRMGNLILGAMVMILMTVGAGYTKADFIYIDKPGAWLTYPNGIDGDTIVGYAGGGGFICDISTSPYSWSNFALTSGGTSYWTTPQGIGDGYIVGHYAAGWRDYIGFLYNIATGAWVTLDFAYETIAFDVDGGYVVGVYGTSGSYQGFVYEIATAKMSTLNAPTSSTYLNGIDMDAGTGGIICASSVPGYPRSWLYDMGTKEWTRLYGPNGEDIVFLFGIDGNYITGTYGTNQMPFLYNTATDTWTLFNVPGAVGASPPQGIGSGKIVGYYSDPGGSVGRGFIYTFDQASTPAEQIQQILDFVYDSVAAGTLVGAGPGNSAQNRLVAVMNMLEAAHTQIEAEWFAQACHQLRDVLKKCDGQSFPPDTVAGTARAELAAQISALMDDICEDTMFSPAEVMTWVPPYVAKSSLIEVKKDFGTCGPKDGLTRVGLQFWVPRADGTIKYADHEWYTPTDADVAAWRGWCNPNNIKCLLCIYNNIGAWDWNLARSAFVDPSNRARFVSALVSRMEDLHLDGIDVDLEGVGNYDGDRNAFAQFIHDLSLQVRARGKILTVDTFSRTANAPNINWWVDWVRDVDNIHSMGYDDLYEGGTDFQKYSNQQAMGYLSGYDRDVVLMGMPAFKSSWGVSSGRGTSAQAHVQEVHYDLPEPTGIAIWSLQHLLVTEPPFGWSPWRNSDLWCEIKELKGDD